jgi:hypothetical protein
MNTYTPYTNGSQNIQNLNMEIAALERKIKNKSIWLFVLTGLAVIGTVIAAIAIGFTHYAVIIDMVILIGLIIAGVLITKHSKTGFILAIVLLVIGGVIQIIGLITGPFNASVLGGLVLRFSLIWFMVTGIKELEQLSSLKAQYQQAVYAAQRRAQEESQAAYAQAPETQFPQ